MKTFIAIILILTGQVIVAFGQNESLKSIEVEVDRINSNRNLIIKEFDASGAFGQQPNNC